MDTEMRDAAIHPPQTQVSAEVDMMDIDGPVVTSVSAGPTSAPEEEDDLANADDTDREDEEQDEEQDGTKKLIVNPAPKPRKISERKRADHAAFEEWIEENQETFAKGVEKLVVADDVKSFQTLIRDFENKRIISSPRDYQLELFELAKKQNTIAVLDTGSGKTLIAALLLRWTIQAELENRSKGAPKRIAFFLVDKVALVFQQHAVLTCNLDYPVEKFCGDMVEDVSKAFWEKTFSENMAIVCTAEILYQCLTHSYIRMQEINLLVFDEAHHTKKNHPYARIIKDFYIEVEDQDQRPRILGMTASPVDAQIDPKVAAAELEALLHSQIATVADPAALQNSSSRIKREVMVEYARRPPNWETELNQAIGKLVGEFRVFQKPLAFTTRAAAELGPWCADRYWQLYFEDEDSIRHESKAEREILRQSAYSMGMSEKIDKVKEAHGLVKQHQFARPSLEQLSHKVRMLLKILRDQFSSVDHDRRCIVFVMQRNVATLLVDLLKQPEMRIPGLEPGVLVGGGRPEGSHDGSKVTYRDQVLTIVKFKRGEINCVFATSVAEEGLDIPDCNVVVRYDLNTTLIQYIQSRGRARRAGSVYIHMAERGNVEHLQRLRQNQNSEDALRKFCEAMPEDRKLTGNNYNMDYFLRKEKGQRQYTVPSTGAKLNYKQSLICLTAFVASLPHPPEVNLSADYAVLSVPGGYQGEVILPDASPIRNATGRIYANKAVAKCSAAYEMCLKLIQGKYLDEHLKPIFAKQLPAMRNARLAVSSKKREQYKMRLKPEIWSGRGEPVAMYITVLTLASPEVLGRPSAPLLLLTRQPVQQVASFPLYFGGGKSSAVECVSVPGQIELAVSESEGLTTFTLAVFKDVFSKEYEATAADLPYFLAPTKLGHGAERFAAVSEVDTKKMVDWETVKYVQENERVPYRFNDEPDAFFHDKFVTDPYDGSRKFILRGRRHDMKPTDAVPPGIVAPGHRAWRVTCKEHDISNYSLSAWSKSRALLAPRADQPVVAAELLSIRRNMLDDRVDEQDLQPRPCFLVLEPLRISPLPVDVVAMIYLFPAIVHRIDSNLVALEACKKLGLELRPDLALEAFTKEGDTGDHENQNEHEHNLDKVGAGQVNAQGAGHNYERLEFLGDCFLKMATTISIFTLIPDKGEFEYHVERMLLICNRNLFNNALDLHLEEYIRSMAFDRRTWYPEGLTLKRGKHKADASGGRQHVLADKTIADVCEALIGAAYLTAQAGDPPGFDLAIRTVSLLVRDKNHAMASWPEYYAAYQPPTWQTAPCNSAQLDMAARFAERMGYTFTHPRLLRSAFQHPTYPFAFESVPSYQRLEFLGDALLDMACIDFLFHSFPKADPQWLTEHKMAMVSNQFLGCLAVYLGFHKSLLMCSASLQAEVGEYVADVELALEEAKKKAVAEGKSEDDFAKDFWLSIGINSSTAPGPSSLTAGAGGVGRRPPKCLPDVLEAYIGALFVDSCYDFSLIRQFFTAHIRPFFENMAPYDTYANNHPIPFFASLLLQRMGCTEWRIHVKEIPASSGPATGAAVFMAAPQVVCAMRVHGLPLAHTVGQSSRYGRVAVAKKAARLLEGMDVEGFRKGFGCSCRGVVNGEGKGE
ncbi:dicer-like protein 1 [Dichotomopilus funicola]|uniref:Dicer-like protein 1 n=1 Tax=Dichotomopilus funicola TaxID=1934379 RepID=A0AAN6ZQS0_9PEZI|nr:dicer-like protein 1 [Dichotomopilus funicola]